MAFQESIGLEAVEAESLAEAVMSEDAPAQQVNGECLATGCGKVRGLGPEPLLDVRGQVDVKTDVHGMFLSSRAGCLGFGHDPRWDEVGQPALVGIDPRLDQVVPPGEGFAPDASIEKPNRSPWSLRAD